MNDAIHVQVWMHIGIYNVMQTSPVSASAVARDLGQCGGVDAMPTLGCPGGIKIPSNFL